MTVAERALDWCDRCGTWCAAGTTRPYEPRSIYRICQVCMSAVQDDQLDAYEAAYGPDADKLATYQAEGR